MPLTPRFAPAAARELLARPPPAPDASKTTSAVARPAAPRPRCFKNYIGSYPPGRRLPQMLQKPHRQHMEVFHFDRKSITSPTVQWAR